MTIKADAVLALALLAKVSTRVLRADSRWGFAKANGRQKEEVVGVLGCWGHDFEMDHIRSC